MGNVMRRSLPSLGLLMALLLAVGFAAVVFVGGPVWLPVAFAVGVILVQYLINPLIIEWLVPATVVEQDGQRYLTDHALGEIVARRCRDAGVPLVRLGIVDDGTPNAFTFGRTRRDARIWVSRGILERLDERELDAVVTHEIGHIKHWDFAVMTVAAVIPMALYLLYSATRDADEDEARALAGPAYAAYLVSELTILALSRARETAADLWSCECTGDGDALASALVKIAYGIGQSEAERKIEVEVLHGEGKSGKAEARRLERRAGRARAMRAMGIFEPTAAEAMQACFAKGIDPELALGAMGWETVNPWAGALERLSSHPLVGRRIQNLETSGLPGAPRHWSVLRAVTAGPPEQIIEMRSRFATELAVAMAPWTVLVLAGVFRLFNASLFWIGAALVIAGGLFLLKQTVKYPMTFSPVPAVAGLLARIDAGPVRGIGVEVRGEIIGRGFPGYVFSPDLVVQDASGFAPLTYVQPFPFAADLFGLLQAEDFVGREVVARGWYRRSPGPRVELREVAAAGGRRARSLQWMACYAMSAITVLVGLVTMAIGFPL